MIIRNYGHRYLAANVRVSNNTFITGQNNNDIICGPSGTGKTGSYVSPNLQNPSESLVVVDTKGQLYKNYKDSLVKKGFKVDVVDFVNPKNSTCGYNPFGYIGKTGRNSYSQKDIKTIIAALMPDSHKDDPYWNQSSRKYISMLVSFVVEFLPKKDHNLTSVLEIHREISAKSEKMLQHLRNTAEESPTSMFAGEYKQVMALMDSEKTWACVLDFASSTLDIYGVKELNILWKRRTVDFAAMGREKRVLFVNISDMDRTYDNALNLIYIQALQILVSIADKNPDGRLDYPVRFIMDDFASGAAIKDFDRIISVIRSRDIAVSLIIQSLSQLDGLYGKDNAKTILNNCDNFLYLGSNDRDSKEYISQRTNKPVHIIEKLPTNKAYLLSSGKPYKIVDKIPPYSKLEDLEAGR